MASLLMKTGVSTDSQIIDTGLSSITQLIVYRQAMSSIGIIIALYNSERGTTITCKNALGLVKGSSSYLPTIEGGVITFYGEVGNTYGLATGEEYTWIAYGE